MFLSTKNINTILKKILQIKIFLYMFMFSAISVQALGYELIRVDWVVVQTDPKHVTDQHTTCVFFIYVTVLTECSDQQLFCTESFRASECFYLVALPSLRVL